MVGEPPRSDGKFVEDVYKRQVNEQPEHGKQERGCQKLRRPEHAQFRRDRLDERKTAAGEDELHGEDRNREQQRGANIEELQIPRKRCHP